MLKFRSNKIWSLMIILLLIFPLCISISNLQSDRLNRFEITENIKQSGDGSDIDLSFIPEINYTALNATWYDPKVEMLIITPDDSSFVSAVTPLMNWKNQKGIKTEIRNASSYSGTDAEQVKNLIIDYYENENLQWVILAGDAQNDRIPIKTVSNPGSGDEPTDFYYADLNSNWNDITTVDWTAEVYVGRLPADTSSELTDMVDKILKYEKAPNNGSWMNQMLLAAGISNYPELPKDPDGEDEARLSQYIWQNYVQQEMNFTHMYRTTSYFTPISTTGEQTLNRSNFRTEIDNGYSTVFFAGHGSDGSFADADIIVFQEGNGNTDASSVSNTNMPSLFYSDACSTAKYDDDGGIGEILIKKASAGAIGYIGGLRDTYYYTEDPNFFALNRANARLFWQEFFQNNKYQQGRAFFDSKVSYWNSEYVQLTFSEEPIINPYAHYRNLLTYNLLGDPELDVYTDRPQNVTNPFPTSIYEGQLVSVQLVPYANVHLTTVDGMYHTAHADENGTAKFRLPLGEDIIYNVTITGHNYIPTNFSFTTLQDITEPTPNFAFTPQVPSTFDKFYFNAFTDEDKSGIESIHMFTSLDGFDHYEYYSLTNDFLENISNLEIELGKLVPNEYDYSLYIFARDYANNTDIFVYSFSIILPLPLTDYLLFGALILIISFAGISVLVIRKGTRKYSDILKRIGE